jgi:hypothetical protein
MLTIVAKNVQLLNSVIYVLIHGQGFAIIRQNVPHISFECFYNFLKLILVKKNSLSQNQWCTARWSNLRN